jgi:hypothetical protein
MWFRLQMEKQHPRKVTDITNSVDVTESAYDVTHTGLGPASIGTDEPSDFQRVRLVTVEMKKQEVRDLNMHAKSHGRPYKCKVPSCEYETLGWPTQKELEWHEDAKHSASPRTFACWFQPCPYMSKRESNCKQHMEKVHHWVFVRSKSNGGKSPHRPAKPSGARDPSR